MAPLPDLAARAAATSTTPHQPPNLVYTSAIIFAFFSLLVALSIMPPLFWHYRNRNIGATLCIFWAILMNLLNFLNAVLWPNDDIPHWFSGTGLCDIEVKLQIAWSVAAPATLGCVLRGLANAMDTERMSLSKTKAQRWRGYALDLVLCVGLPGLAMLFNFFVQFKRYFVYGISGCVPTASRSWVTVVLLYVPPLVLVLVDAYFAVLILVRLCRYRRTFTVILANNQTTKSRFLRLYILCAVWILLIIPLSIWTLLLNLHTPREPFSWSAAHDYKTWSDISLVPSNGHIVFDRFIWLGSGAIVFLTFGFGKDALSMYRSGLLSLGLGHVFASLRRDYDRSSRATTQGSISSIGSKARLYFATKRKPSASAASWQTKSWQTATTSQATEEDAPSVSPRHLTFLESVSEDAKSEPDARNSTPSHASDANVKQQVSGPRATQSAFTRMVSAFKPHGSQGQQDGNSVGLADISSGDSRAGSRASSSRGQMGLEENAVLVTREVRQGSEAAEVLPPVSYGRPDAVGGSS